MVRFRDRMQHEVLVRQGDHAFVPADLPHAPCNESGAPCTWLVVQSSGSNQDGIVMPPELDEVLAARSAPSIETTRAVRSGATDSRVTKSTPLPLCQSKARSPRTATHHRVDVRPDWGSRNRVARA